MKYVCMILCVLMVLFIAVQYNDPDGLLWSVIYAVPAFWAGIAGFRIKLASGTAMYSLLWASTILILALTVYYWPTTPGFWQKDVWWNTETAREGMGMMICTVVILAALFTIQKSRREVPA